jgi:hypothetical protein
MINFDINTRINQMIWSPVPEDTQLSSLPDFKPIFIDILRALDKPTPPDPVWEVFDGPAIYVLIDTFWDLRRYPHIVWVGQSDHMKRRVRWHQRREEILFDSVRGVFIENAAMRRVYEQNLIAQFSHPDSVHCESLENKKHRKKY